ADEQREPRELVRSGRRRSARPGRAAEPRSGVTIYQVAERAGVSITTVSRVLRDSGPVAADTRDRVEAAVAELRFTPSRLGRGLAERRHSANGIVLPTSPGPTTPRSCSATRTWPARWAARC